MTYSAFLVRARSGLRSDEAVVAPMPWIGDVCLWCRGTQGGELSADDRCERLGEIALLAPVGELKGKNANATVSRQQRRDKGSRVAAIAANDSGLTEPEGSRNGVVVRTSYVGQPGQHIVRISIGERRT